MNIEDYESQIRKSNVEICGIFKDGELIFTKTGSETKINIINSEIPDLSGCIFTHNHPKNGSFSIADISWACDHNLKEIRVVASNTIYRMKLKDDSNLSDKLYCEKINFQVLDYRDAVRDEFKNIPNHNNSHEMWLRLTKDIPELDYIRSTSIPLPLDFIDHKA